MRFYKCQFKFHWKVLGEILSVKQYLKAIKKCDLVPLKSIMVTESIKSAVNRWVSKISHLSRWGRKERMSWLTGQKGKLV